MRALVIGDIGWSNLYHLGDEAMTEVAVRELSRRDVSPVLVSGEVSVAEQMYSVPAVPRLGFWSREGAPEHRQRLEKLHAALHGDAGHYDEQLQAVEECDFVVIAGGGNLNDGLQSHVYERLGWKRIAEHFGKPLVMTSQTIGPALSGAVKDAVTEILFAARLVGCRDEFSAKLASSLSGDPRKVHRTLDDAVLLEVSSQAEEEAAEVVSNALGHGRYSLGAFTSHVGTTGYSRKGYVEAVGEVLSRVFRKTGIPFLLTPHVGSLMGKVRDDEENHQRIADSVSDGESVVSLPTLRAQTVLALTRNAHVSTSTRYHPGVFAMMSGTPHVGLIQSYYSSVKVRGALGNYGLGVLGVPFVDPDDAVGALMFAANNGSSISRAIGSVNAPLIARQRAWWDMLVASLAGEELLALPEFPRVFSLSTSEEWATRTQAMLPLFEALSRARQ